MAITTLELAEHRGLKKAEDGSFSAADIYAVGLPMLGGCAVCGASIACYNAYPSHFGFWKCEDCIGEDGFGTVEEANRAIFPDDAPAPKAAETTTSPKATIYALATDGDGDGTNCHIFTSKKDLYLHLASVIGTDDEMRTAEQLAEDGNLDQLEDYVSEIEPPMMITYCIDEKTISLADFAQLCQRCTDTENPR